MILRHIFISAAHNFFGHHGQPAGTSPAVEVAEAELVAGKGIVGDRYFGWKEDYAGQVTFFSLETHEALCARLGVWDRDASVYRRNLIVEGADLNALIGREFALQGVRFLGIAEAKPCHWMEQAFGKGAEAALEGFGGLRAKVLSSGILRRAPVETALRPGPAQAGTPNLPHGVPASAGGVEIEQGTGSSPEKPGVDQTSPSRTT